VPVVRLREGERELSQVRWGLVPFWAKDVSIGNKMINARAERVATTPGYRDAYRKMRCLIPASGFYEWAKLTDGKKQAVRICMADDSPFAFAGLWSRWGPRDAEIETCAIITTEANELCAKVHNRMPVILAASDYERWLDKTDADPVDLLRPYPSEAMRAHPVSTRVNSPKNDDAGLIEDAAP
jgi:putative SOS response-associated peptidase YedK